MIYPKHEWYEAPKSFEMDKIYYTIFLYAYHYVIVLYSALAGH